MCSYYISLLSDFRLTVVCCVPQGSRDYFGITVLWSHRHVVPRLCDSWTFSGLAPLSWGTGVRPGKQPSSHQSLFSCHWLLAHRESLYPHMFLPLPSSFCSICKLSQHFRLVVLTSMTHFLLFEHFHMESFTLSTAFSPIVQPPVPISALILTLPMWLSR